MRLLPLVATLSLLLFAGCQSAREPAIRHARLGDAAAFAALRASFAANNPGYDLAYHGACRELARHDRDRVVFVQGPAERTLAPTVGDVLLVRAGERWRLEADAAGDGVDLLAFSLPTPLPSELPRIVRPDWDPQITDTPGGCATEGDAYRRILLTWKPEVGPYVLHQLNAHRVRIRDSFSHYHPVDGGFDEFYLVQQAPAGARLLTSTDVAAIESRAVSRERAKSLVASRELHVGDLVYLPRGTMHRGLGGALVQVISVPGFVPQREIGVDHHLWAINRQLGLCGADALPFHVVAARTQVVK
ncbi:MAG: hypothetical protein KAI24_08555 [Planctomycetes bacterium]|nr:hypothetical protein [Planctomycetota bacterium]